MQQRVLSTCQPKKEITKEGNEMICHTDYCIRDRAIICNYRCVENHKRQRTREPELKGKKEANRKCFGNSHSKPCISLTTSSTIMKNT